MQNQPILSLPGGGLIRAKIPVFFGHFGPNLVEISGSGNRSFRVRGSIWAWLVGRTKCRERCLGVRWGAGGCGADFGGREASLGEIQAHFPRREILGHFRPFLGHFWPNLVEISGQIWPNFWPNPGKKARISAHLWPPPGRPKSGRVGSPEWGGPKIPSLIHGNLP